MNTHLTLTVIFVSISSENQSLLTAQISSEYLYIIDYHLNQYYYLKYSLFCEECITKYATSKGSTFHCPVCRKECARSRIQRIEFIKRKMLQLRVKCPNYEITPQRALYLKQSDKTEQLSPLSHHHRDRNRNNKNTTDNRGRSRSRSRERFVIYYSYSILYEI